MRPKTPQLTPAENKEERETRLRSFILAGLDQAGTSRSDAIAVLAQSPESPVARAVLSLSEELARRGLGATIILTGAATATANDTWNLEFHSGFVHEIRLTTNPRVLDGHEQLVVGDTSVWYGDCMRRDPLKRDTFERFIPDEPASGRAARLTFSRLWSAAQPIFANDAVASVTIAKVSSATAAAAAMDEDEIPGPAATEAGPSDTGIIDPSRPIAETLGAWRPSTRH